MKRSEKPLNLQMNLSLLSVSATAVPDDKQRELTLALMELLIKAAQKPSEPLHTNGGENEPKAHA
jgi:hypothetical protein